MKNRIWIALLLGAALAVPAIAQQTSTSSNSSQNQPAATSTQQSAQPAAQGTQQQTEAQAASDQNLSARQPLKADEKQGFWGKINPFARKKYVQRQMAPVRNRVNELDELTASNSKMIKDVDSRAQEGIRMASTKANEADQHAIEAGNRAQQANQTAQEASTRLNTVQQVVSNIDQFKPVTETEIRFRPGQAALSKQAKDALDQMATPLANQKGYIIEVQGFSPGRGQAAIQDSQSLAQSVVRYLVLNHNVPVYRIYVLGMGNAPVQSASTEAGASTGRKVRGRRVQIALLKNDTDQLSGQSPVNTPGPSGATTGEGGMTGATTQQPTGNQPTQPATAQPSAPTQPQTPPPSTPPPTH